MRCAWLRAASRFSRLGKPRPDGGGRRCHLADRAQERLYPRLPKASWTARLKAFFHAFWGLWLIGIYGGIFTPTEAAAMSADYAFVIAGFAYRDLSLREVPGVLLVSANLSAKLLYNNHHRGVVLLPDDAREDPADAGQLDYGSGARLDRLLADRQHPAAACAGNVMEPSSIMVMTAPNLFPGGDDARNRADPRRHLGHSEYGGGPVPPAGGAEPLRCVRHHQAGHAGTQLTMARP